MPHPADPSPAPPPSGFPRFTGRAAIVTGAARGMGRAFAFALADEGCNLVLCDVLDGLPDGTKYPKATQAEFEQAVAECEKKGVRCTGVTADVADADAAGGLIERALEEFGRLDFLITNAGVMLEGKIADLSPRVFEAVLRNNVLGTFNVMAPALKVMTAAKRGRIVAISSGAGRHGLEEAAAYVASKWGVIGLVKTAALEAAKSGVTVNAILPGPVDTPMLASNERFREAVPDKPNPTRGDYLEASKDATPMGYAWVKAEDVAAAVLFLLSDEARLISGETLSIDAGDSANWT